MSSSRQPAWIVANQSISPAFQRLMERLARELGDCLILTGTRFPTSEPRLKIKRLTGYSRKGLPQRALSWGRFIAEATVQFLRTPANCFAFAGTNPPMLMHAVWAASRVRGFKYGLLIWDVYPDHLVQIGWLGGGSPLAGAWCHLNRKALHNAEFVVTIGEGMAEAIRRQIGDGENVQKVLVIPNWADTERIRPRAKSENPFAIAHGQVGKLTVLYSGNIGATHGLVSLIHAAERLRESKDISFLIVGEGLGKSEVEAAARARELKNVQFLNYQEWEDLPLSLATGDLAVVVQAPGTEQLSMPSKTYSSLAAGSAILALTDRRGDLGRLVEQENVGIVLPRDSPDAIASAIAGLALDHPRLSGMKANARRVAERQFSEEAVLRQFLGVLAPLMRANYT